MLLIYDVIVEILKFSENIEDFIKNIFCRNMNGEIFTKNKQQLDFLDEEYNVNIYNDVCKKFERKITL